MKIKLTIGTFLLGLLFVAALVVPLFHAGTGVAMAAAATVLSDEEKAAQEELLKKIQSKIDASIETRAKKEDINAAIIEALKKFEGLPLDELRKMADVDKGVMKILVEQGAEIAKLKEQGTQEDLSTRAQVANWVTKNKEAIQKVKAGHKAELPSLELRVAASPMKFSTVNSGTSSYIPTPFIESGLHDLRRVAYTFWDYIPKGRTSQAAYVWVNKYNPQGAASFIGEGVAKPGISFELRTEISNAKKVAESLKCSTELLEDIDGMTTFIDGELRYALLSKMNTTLMTGTLSSTVPAGIQTFSKTYTLTGVATDNPNLMDVIRAGVAQIRTKYISEPVTVFINPVDAANMDLAKADTSGVYLLPPFVTSDGRTVAGAAVVEDNNVTANKIQFACLGLLKTLIYKDYTVTFGWENDDFTKNLVTAVAEMRIHSFHSDNDAEGFIYDTISTIKTAITAS